MMAFGASALAAPFASFAQQPGKVWRIGILHTETQASAKARVDAFIQGLAKLGYVEAKNVTFVPRYADGQNDRLPALAEDLMRQKPDVIFAPNTPTVRAARKVAGSTPIVFAHAGDPVATGLVNSLRQPGGNITGTSNINTELAAKRLEILKETIPAVSRVAVFVGEASDAQTNALAPAAKALGIQLQLTDSVRGENFELTLAALRKWRAHAIYITSTPTATQNRALHAEFAAKLRVPAIAGITEFVEAGGFMSYGPSFEALYRQAATYVDRILKGAKPGDLPIEQPTVFELAINMKTAKALGITIPKAVLFRADKVIE